MRGYNYAKLLKLVLRENQMLKWWVSLVLIVPGALFASKNFVIEFTLSGVTSSVQKDKICIWVLFDAFFVKLTMLIFVFIGYRF